MAVPDYQSLMLPVLTAAAEGEIRMADVIDRVAERLDLSAEDRAELLPSGKQGLLRNRVHWAKTYLAKAGLLIVTKRGHFVITDRGKQAVASQPRRIDNKFLSQFEEFRNFADKAEQTVSQNGVAQSATAITAAETPDEKMRIAYQQLEAALSQDLLDRIRAAPPDFFERLIINLLLSMGYGGSTVDAGRVLGGSGDNGVDGVIDQDALGLDRVYIQAKRYAEGNSIGSSAIRDFFGSLDRHKATKGLFVTTSDFSASARETAEFLSKCIVLVDGKLLARLMIRHNVGCRIEETFHIKKVDEDFFE